MELAEIDQTRAQIRDIATVQSFNKIFHAEHKYNKQIFNFIFN